MDSRLIIRNVSIIDPDKEYIYVGDIFIANGIIQKIVSQNDQSVKSSEMTDMIQSDGGFKGAEIIDATGWMAGPGLADTHVHFRDPGFTHKEDIISGAMAAKKGGYTQIVLMANTNPHVDNPETLSYVLQKGRQTGININTCANVTMGMKGETLTDMEPLLDGGAVGFTDDGVPLINEALCMDAMIKCMELGVPISFHEENPSFIDNNGVNRGKASDHYKIGGSPREAEIDLIERDIRLATQIKAEYGKSPCIVIQHISTKEGVDIVRKAKQAGLDVHAEATPHHFSLTEEAVIRKGTNAKMNPPLRTEEDRLAICEGLKDGTIDLIATDHAPHAKEEKDKDITVAPSGIIGLETALPLAIKNLINTRLMTYNELFGRMSKAPCELYGLTGGSLKEGEAANLVVFNPDESFVVSKEEIASKSHNTPFIGETLPGVIKYTICNGCVVYKA